VRSAPIYLVIVFMFASVPAVLETAVMHL
jgi:hypothetical protein